MTDENINPQNIPIQSSDSNLTDQKSPPLNSRKTILVILAVVLVIGIPVLFFNQAKKGTKSTIIPTVSPRISITISGQPDPSSEAQITPEFVPDEVIIKYKSGQSPDEIKDENKKNKLEEFLEKLGVISQEKVSIFDDPDLNRTYRLKLKKGSDVFSTINLLQEIEEIEYAEPNGIQKTF